MSHCIRIGKKQTLESDPAHKHSNPAIYVRNPSGTLRQITHQNQRKPLGKFEDFNKILELDLYLSQRTESGRPSRENLLSLLRNFFHENARDLSWKMRFLQLFIFEVFCASSEVILNRGSLVNKQARIRLTKRCFKSIGHEERIQSGSWREFILSDMFVADCPIGRRKLREKASITSIVDWLGSPQRVILKEPINFWFFWIWSFCSQVACIAQSHSWFGRQKNTNHAKNP